MSDSLANESTQPIRSKTLLILSYFTLSAAACSSRRQLILLWLCLKLFLCWENSQSNIVFKMLVIYNFLLNLYKSNNHIRNQDYLGPRGLSLPPNHSAVPSLRCWWDNLLNYGYHHEFMYECTITGLRHDCKRSWKFCRYSAVTPLHTHTHTHTLTRLGYIT